MSFFVTLTEDGTYMPTMAGFTALVIFLIGALLVGNYFFGIADKKTDSKRLAFSAMAIALATVCSMVKIIDMPMGGSVTLFSMMFISLIGSWFGLGAGLSCGIAYGLLQLTIDPYILSFPQMMVDYILGFGALGLSGLFYGKKNGLIKGYLTGVLGRYFFCFLSGWIFFGAYAPESFPNAVTYSLAYNAAYIGVEAALTCVVLALPPVRVGLTAISNLAADPQASAQALSGKEEQTSQA